MFSIHNLEVFEEVKAVNRQIAEYSDDVMDIERTLRTKMAKLSPHQFEGCLHPVFEEGLCLTVFFLFLCVFFGCLSLKTKTQTNRFWKTQKNTDILIQKKI